MTPQMPMNTSDHDLLITLSARMENAQSSHREFSGQILLEISKVSAKIDQVRDIQTSQDRRIYDLEGKDKILERQIANQDLRIATLEQQVETLQDVAEKQAAVTEAMKNDAKKRDEMAEKRVKRFGFIITLITFGVAMLPKLWEWLRYLVTVLAMNPVLMVQMYEVARYAVWMTTGIFF